MQLLRQGDSQVFKRYSQMKLKMQGEVLEKLNRQANEMTAQIEEPVLETGTVLAQV